ncbi:hypothetical protein GE21DRAFT_5858, partial [Neurospora crassa]|uniref:PAS domain-containing protein n=1 Tax=Neurospora crassa (strain ATCC 24698 / 74-OR23-1A / CBS 708.71 / DSM 1257 / FGSC 987) TaxID=367110 RepID=Q7S9F7_NEUCR|eukprot:XP_962228.2 hypothetical protein NCU06390 [Neurospora crassa OR74A]
MDIEQTFMTIHNLTAKANILFASDSILDILGYHPDEVRGKSCFDHFHPDDVALARRVHQEGVLLDKAAVLHYTRIASRDGKWINCECCFTVVHDVLVASTSVYLGGLKSERRKLDAPHIERIFSSAPRDPRYHMLEHMSPKFTMPPAGREPRAALILNRFTRNLSIMFATNAVESILGISPEEIKDKPFYECIQENCLQEAIQVLESAKANESIAYLRFWFRDPRIGTDGQDDEEEEDEDEDDNDSGEEESDEDDDEVEYLGSRAKGSKGRVVRRDDDQMDIDDRPSRGEGRGEAKEPDRRPSSFELEAVVSCTSDGLVVVLRRARPQVPEHVPQPVPVFTYENGLFAAPWGLRPIEPSVPPELLHIFRPPLLPQHMPLKENVRAAGGPPMDQLMRSIRDVAVFAWALVGINGNIANYAHGFPPRDETQPPAADGRYQPGRDSRASNHHLAHCREYYNPNNGRSLAATARASSPPEYPSRQQALPSGSGSGSGCTCRGAGAGSLTQRQHTPGMLFYAPPPPQQQPQQRGFESRPGYQSQAGGVFCRGALQQPSEEPGSPVPSSSISPIMQQQQQQQQHYHRTPPLRPHHHHSPSPMLSPRRGATPESEYAPAPTPAPPARHDLPPEPWTAASAATATATASTTTQAAPDGNEMRRNSRFLWQ